ncbi:MAG: sel1 repeat family protein [Clostridia bacterium]|nr:sel1 repeat family protein [Clostridia bacterium]
MGLFDTNLSAEEKYGKACLLTFSGKQKSFEKGYKIFAELDQNGFSEAALVLAMMSQNLSEKYQYIIKAASTGNCEAIWQSTMFMPHSFIPNKENPADALWENTCLKAAERFNVDAMNEMGNVYNRRKNYAEAMYWYSMANAYGHKDGRISQTGLASAWLAAGAPRTFLSGSPRFDKARFDCAISYLEWNAGMKISKPIQEIIAYVLDGIPIAAFLAGDIFESLNNDEMAYKMYNAISFTNDPHGLRCYADMLMMGKGTGRDPAAAQKYYELAARGGDREAMFITGEFLKMTNANMAAYWYGLSHVRGYKSATDRLQQLANR